tara:strand:- start:12887 stop:14782 length:1896 start_codon:yes stop_codon:yes gene_type:complete
MAWAGRSPKTFSPDKFNLLGIMNEVRGTDSCGVAVDGEIYFGVNTTKRYRDFLADGGYPIPTTIPIVIGHTRNSTVGGNTIENAHPFGFGDAKTNKEFYAFIGVHNGTLYNQKDLAATHNVSVGKEKKGAKNNTYSVDKIDSEILLEILYTSKKFKVLSQYNGAAALVWYHIDEPEIMYAFHGASVKSLGGFDKANYIERELWAWQEHRNSLYISSQDHALAALGGTKENMVHLQTNVVYKIKHGNLATAQQFPLSRASQQHERVTAYKKKNKTFKQQEFELDQGNGLTNAYTNGRGGSKTPVVPFRGSSIYTKVSSAANIHNDKKVGPKNKKVSMEGLRYNRNGHGINGIYVWIPSYGFHFLGFKVEASEKTFKALIGKQWFKGDFVYDQSILEGADAKDIKIPFPDSIKIGASPMFNCMSYFHYFLDGCKITSYLDWKSARDLENNGNGFSIQALSGITCHPIADVKNKADDNAQGIFFRGVLANTPGFTPLGSQKTYTISKGNCTEITLVDTAAHRSPFSNLEVLMSKLNENEDGKTTGKGSEDTTIIHKLDSKSSDSIPVNTLLDAVEEDLLENLIDDMFLPAIEKFQQNRERLTKYKNTELGKDALELLTDFIKGAGQIVASELNH